MTDIFAEILADADRVELPNDTEIRQIKDMVADMQALDARISKGEALLAELKETRRKIAENLLPDAMGAMGLSTLTLDTGQKLEIKPELYVSIRKDFAEQALSWLEEQGYGDIIKHEIKALFGKGESEDVKKLIDILQQYGYGNYVESRSVHPQTLKGFIKAERAVGREFPEEYFSIADIKVAKIK